MSLISRPHLKFELAKALHDYIKANANNTYFYFGKADAWEDEENPPSITGNRLDADILKNMIMLNRVSELDVYMCYDRIDWEKDTVFNAYDSSMPEQNVHVLTEDMRVYKCLDNLRGAKSLIKPNHTTFGPVNYEDGYTWKYLYTLSNREIHNYLTDEYIPINIKPVINSIQNQTEHYAVRGTVDTIRVISGGSNYTRATITINGDGTGATARAIIQSGIIKAIKVVNPGEGYTHATATVTGTGIEASVEVDVSPLYGHGSNLPKELNASSVMVISQQYNSAEDLSAMPAEFNYRQVGLISGITSNVTGRIAIPMTFKVRVSDSTEFVDGSKAVLNNTINCTIVSKEVTDGTHYLYIAGIQNHLSGDHILNKSLAVGSIKTTILEVVNTPLKITKDFNILHLENLSVQAIENKNLDILRLVIKGLPTEIEK